MTKDLHASGGDHHLSAAGLEVSGGGELWLDRSQAHEDLLADVDDSMFYGSGDFPPLPDFPCMSSSSSSSSTPAPEKPIAAVSSSSSYSASSVSRPVLKSETGEYSSQPAALSSTASMEVTENFEFLDLMESNDFFDPCSLFQDYPMEDFEVPDLRQERNDPLIYGQENHNQFVTIPSTNNNIISRDGFIRQHSESLDSESNDLGAVFLEWLKTNKETVCAEDLRRVKIKKATIECAAKRLGGGKEAMKQLLKLILEWVQNNQLQKKRLREAETVAAASAKTVPNLQNQNPNSLHLSQTLWNVLEAPTYDPIVPTQCFAPVAGCNTADQPYLPALEYHMQMNPAPLWPASQFSYASFADPNLCSRQPALMAGYGGSQYPYQYFSCGGPEKLVRLGSSATKEARKKRMARQRRFLTHNRNHQQSTNQQNQSSDQQHARIGGENCTLGGGANPGNWMYHWSSGMAPTAVVPVDAPKPQLADRPAAQVMKPSTTADRRQGWKPEKNLRFLLQKVLKQSDVGNLGRIVLPKKEAETHLPELEARDGISISMEDIGTSRVWNMRYRFWPNNKSRMYLLENTGDFVRANGLQEGDFIVIYSDVKCGKYLIRGVKVRQPGPKSETKRPAKSQRNRQSASPAGISLSTLPVTPMVK